MASTIGLLCEKSFLCFLCRDVFTSPVTIPCGHSFCKACLGRYWSKHQSTNCPQCRRVFSTRPDLSVNRILAEVSDDYRTNRPEKPPVSNEVNIGQMIQERQQKIERLKYSLQLLKTSCLREVRESQRVFSTLVNSMEKNHKLVVAAIEERQQEAESKVELLVQELKQEIRALKTQELRKESSKYASQMLRSLSVDNLDQSVLSSSSSASICAADMKDWTKVTMETDPCVAVTRRALSEMMDMLKEEVNRLSKLELKRIQKYTAVINLSPKTAHPSLSISEDRKQVRHTDKLYEVPDNPKRFDRVANILARESFGTGRYYWEVEVGDKVEWHVGVVRQSINRKGKFTVCPANGFWTLSLKPTGQYTANGSPVTPLAVEERPRKMAVFLDYDEGHVSFYCVESGVHMFTFRDSFTDRLHPFFSPGRSHGGRNDTPLIITSSCCSI